jgi:hypothetical protein
VYESDGDSKDRHHCQIKGANLIWTFADQKVNGFGPAHIEKSHFKGIFGCIFRQSLMK